MLEKFCSSAPNAVALAAPADSEDSRARIAVAREVLSRDRRARLPLVLFDRDALTAQVELWRRHLGEVEPHFAVKTCNAPAVLAHLHALGLSFDAATAGEIRLLERLGVPRERVICTHPIRDEDDLRAIARYRPRALVVENASELRKLERFGIPAKSYSPEIFVRLELPFGGLSGKFGVEVASLQRDEDGELHWKFVTSPARRIFQEARAIEQETGCRYGALGLSSHVGTNTPKTDKYEILLRVFAHLRHRLMERGIEVTRWNLGGGYPDTEKPREHGTTQDAFLAGLGKLVREHAARDAALSFLAEPGRFLVSNSGTVVIGVMQVDERRLLPQADGAYVEVPHLKVQMNDGLYGNLLGERHDEKDWCFVPLRLDQEARPFSMEVLPAILNGKTCDSWDRMARMRALPRDLGAGDLLLVPHAGAYTLVTATDFNSAPRSQMCLYGRDANGILTWQIFDASGTPLPETPEGNGEQETPRLRAHVAPSTQDLGASQHVSLTRIVGSVAGRVEGSLLRPRALVGDGEAWREPLVLVYRNELTLRVEGIQPLEETSEEWRLEVQREGRKLPELLRIGKRVLDASQRGAFEARARAVASLSADARIPTLEAHGFLPEGGHPYALEELVEGQSLESLLGVLGKRTGKPLDWRRGERARRLEHLQQAALVLELAHRTGAVHGALRAEDLIVPILGFGRVQVIGWPLFVTRGAAPADDLRGLGLVLQRALIGEALPERQGTVPATDAPAELVSIVAWSLRPDPEARYASAGELAEDLERFLAGRAVLAHRKVLSGFGAILYSARRALSPRRRGDA